MLSKIYAEIGKFHVAEEFLLGAFSRIAPNDPQAFSIRLKLAQLYLKGFHPERGIRLLRILRTSSPQNKQASILVPLIKVRPPTQARAPVSSSAVASRCAAR